MQRVLVQNAEISAPFGRYLFIVANQKWALFSSKRNAKP